MKFSLPSIKDFLPKIKRHPVVLDTTDQKKIKDTPKIVRREAALSTDKNRWFIATLLLSVVAIIAMALAYSASKRADTNIKVAWVKMFPNGTWDVEFQDENRAPEFFQATIDYLIRQWVERRYSQIPYSIKNDYGYVYNFMSPKLRKEFISSSQFNAPQKAAELTACSACNHIEFKVRTIDHYDSDKTRFGKYEGVLYRSNVFVQRQEKNPDGTLVETTNMIVPLQWRIKATEEIQADKKMLEHNPIGLAIIAYDILKDSSQQNTGGDQ